MAADLYWIPSAAPGRLAIMPRPGDRLAHDVASWRAAGIDTIVSLLEPGEAAALGLASEEALCCANDIDFIAFPIPDFGVPASLPGAATIVSGIAHRLAAGRAIAIHCRGGIGRSAVMAACVLVSGGMDTEAAFDLIRAARGVPAPETEAQRRWAARFAKEQTGRRADRLC